MKMKHTFPPDAAKALKEEKSRTVSVGTSAR